MKGVAVGIPIAISQCLSLSLHQHQLCALSPVEMGLDFALANAIYGGDRLGASSTLLENATAYGSMLGAMTYLSSDAWTLPLAPAVPFLYYEYGRQKKRIAPAKPFVVAAFWTLVSYAQPFLIRHDLGSLVDSLPLSMFLAFAAVSHAADIPDTTADRANGIYTPAVLLDERRSKALTFLLLFASLGVHALTERASLLDGVYDVSLVAYLVLQMENAMLSALVSIICCTYLLGNEQLEHEASVLAVDGFSQMLLASEVPHRVAIRAVPWVIEHTANLPAGMREFVIEKTTETLPLGDKIGSNLIHVYRDLVYDAYVNAHR